MIADDADEARPHEISNASDTRHLASLAGTARSDDYVGTLLQRCSTQVREALRRISPIGVGECQEISPGVVKACLDGCAVATVTSVANQLDILKRSADFSSMILGSAVDDDDLQTWHSNRCQHQTSCQDALNDGTDAVLFIERGADHGKHRRGCPSG